MKKETLTFIAIGLGLGTLLLLVVGFFAGWFKGGQLKLVDGDGDVLRTPSGAIDESLYTSIAQQVRDSLGGLNVSHIYFISIADQLLALNKNELRLTSNIYKTKFSNNDFKTLRSRIQGEWLGSTMLVAHPCTASEQGVINSACYKQKKVVEQLNSINA